MLTKTRVTRRATPWQLKKLEIRAAAERAAAAHSAGGVRAIIRVPRKHQLLRQRRTAWPQLLRTTRSRRASDSPVLSRGKRVRHGW